MREAFRTLHPRGDRKPMRAFSFLEVEGDEEPPLVMIRALDDRHAVHRPAGEGSADRLRQNLAVDDRRGAAGGVALVRKDVRDRQPAQTGGGLVGAAGLGGEGGAGVLGGGERRLRQLVGAALGYGAGEQAVRQRRGELRVHAQAARRLAEDGHVERVAAKEDDVAPHPGQRRLLIEDAVVAGDVVGRLGGERGVGQEPERAQPVVDGDHDHVTLLDELRGVVVVALAHHESAAMDPDHHRVELDAIAWPVRGHEHVQEEAVLGGAGEAERARPLRAVGAELRGVAHAVPARVPRRRSPAGVPDRRGSVGDAEEPAGPVGRDAADETFVRQGDRAGGERAAEALLGGVGGGRLGGAAGEDPEDQAAGTRQGSHAHALLPPGLGGGMRRFSEMSRAARFSKNPGGDDERPLSGDVAEAARAQPAD